MDERKLPFAEHLRELRKRLRNAIAALLIACIVMMFWADTLLALLARPLVHAWHLAGLPDPQLKFGGLTEPFWVQFELSMYAGIFVASPIIFHQLWKFIAPGLYDKEKRVAVPFAFFSGLFFVGGGLFCYFFVMPAAFKFFLSYASTNAGHVKAIFGAVHLHVTDIGIEPSLFMEQYLDLTTKMLLGFGIVFELPLLIFFLSYVGLITHRSLWKFNKYWIVLSFIIGGVLTPGPDILSQFLMATPMIVLYELSIVIAWVVTKKRAKAAAKLSST
jgi:sec-independent protein translocase protein TatC